MQAVNVVVTTPIDEALLKRMAAVSDKIKVESVSAMIVGERKGDTSAKEQLDSRLAQAEVLYGWIHHLPRNLLARTPRLKWLQVMSAGVDRLPEDILRSPIAVTCVSGLHAIPISEFVLEQMLMLVKQAPECFRQKQEKRWKRFTPQILHAKTIGIVGLGSIGREVARLAKAFGMRVIGTRRSAKKTGQSRDVDALYPREQLPQLLAESDFVVLTLPLTAETKGMIGEKELRAMKPEAFLINVARGAIVDEEALIRALEEKWIAGAGLDVFVAEPLPPESKFWTLPNVIFSPHVSGEMPDYDLRATEVFCENLRRYLAGKKFLHAVDKQKGY
jgi:D-2-hydroxyacid dehydrogenase (NADP+)